MSESRWEKLRVALRGRNTVEVKEFFKSKQTQLRYTDIQLLIITDAFGIYEDKPVDIWDTAQRLELPVWNVQATQNRILEEMREDLRWWRLTATPTQR